MKILLLGGSGFVSGRILRFALEAGHSVIAITRGKSEFSSPSGFDVIQADRNCSNLSYIAEKYNYDVVIDAICQTPEHAKQSVELSGHCKRLIMISSDYVYEPAYRKLFLKEKEAFFSEQQDYGGNKRRAEMVILAARANIGIQSIILRPPHIYGSGSNPGSIPKHGRKPQLLQDIIEGKALCLLNGGLGLFQPIHVDDLAKIIVFMLDKQNAYNQEYNTSGPELMTHLEYYQTLARAIGRKIEVQGYCPEKNAEDVNYYVNGHRCYDMTKLNTLLPDFKYTPFEAGMQAWADFILKKDF